MMLNALRFRPTPAIHALSEEFHSHSFSQTVAKEHERDTVTTN